MASRRMTQTQLVRHLAERCDVNNKVAQQFLDELGKAAVQGTKKSPGIGRVVKSKGKRLSAQARRRITPSMKKRSAAQRVAKKEAPTNWRENKALETLAEIFSRL
ncbi:MAG: HU family DNA-binding protein [Acidobacteria bacterium]|nr:HU family DNA-binding protein [Acidobacteriota bacterium]